MPEDIAINNAVMRAVGRTVGGINDLDEWQFMLEDQKGGDKSPHYLLVYTSSLGKGQSCAAEKMHTLFNHPEISNTKDMDGRELGPHEVCWYGGINVLYTGFEGPDSTPIKGVVRIVFSGARESIDLVIVLEALKAYIEACDRFLPDSTYLYDLSGLKSDQLSGYLISKIF